MKNVYITNETEFLLVHRECILSIFMNVLQATCIHVEDPLYKRSTVLSVTIIEWGSRIFA